MKRKMWIARSGYFSKDNGALAVFLKDRHCEDRCRGAGTDRKGYIMTPINRYTSKLWWILQDSDNCHNATES